MLLRVGVLVGLALAMSQPGGTAGAEIARPGWRFLPTDYVDTSMGAFHDSDSGAFIAFERGFRSMLTESAPRVASEHQGALIRDTKGSWTYEYVIVPAVRDAAAWSDSCAEGHTEYRRVEASFTSEAAPYIVWNFTAFTCAERERARVLEFLLQDPNRWASLMDAWHANVLELREGDIAHLARGDSLEILQPTLGLASEVERRGAGFELSFSLVHAGGPSIARLRFDRTGKLLDRKVESPPTAR